MSIDPVIYNSPKIPRVSPSDNRRMEYLRVVNKADSTASSLSGGMLSASRFTQNREGHGISDDHFQEDAFLLAYQVRDYQGKLWVDGKELEFAGSKANSFTFYDYSRIWRADLRSSFDCVNFHISRSALRSLEEDLGAHKTEAFNIAAGMNVSDAVVRGIVEALLPIFDGRQDTSQLVLDYVGTGLLVHLATSYGGSRRTFTVSRGGLTPFQLNRATALLDANLDGKLTLADFAKECVLSSSYFAKAFKVTTGISPFKWIANRRIEKATELLRTTCLSLTEIANKCGFSDQSHFTRAFRDVLGVTPAVWRRERQLTPRGVKRLRQFERNVEAS